MPRIKIDEAHKENLVDNRLYLLGCEAVRKGGDAAPRLAKSAENQPELLLALARYYIENRILPDMRGDALKSAQGGHLPGADGQKATAVLRGPVKGERGKKPASDGHFPGSVSPSPDHDRTGQRTRAGSHYVITRPVVKPNPPHRRAAIAAVNRSLWDSFKVRNGKSIGDLTITEARQIAATNEREARILRALCDHVGGHVEPGTTLRDAVKLSVLQRAVAQNVEASDVA